MMTITHITMTLTMSHEEKIYLFALSHLAFTLSPCTVATETF